jgi:hypothetical protein
VHIFVTGPAPAAYETTPENTHLFYYPRPGRQGFWPQQMPLVCDPVCAVGFDGDSDDKRIVMMGCRDGFIRHFAFEAVSDHGVPINGRVVFGPIEPAGAIREGKATAVDLILGELPEAGGPFTDEDNWHLEWTLQGGRSAKEAVEDPLETAEGEFDESGEQRPQGVKMAASTFALKFENDTEDKFFSIDRVDLRFNTAGRQR